MPSSADFAHLPLAIQGEESEVIEKWTVRRDLYWGLSEEDLQNQSIL